MKIVAVRITLKLRRESGPRKFCRAKFARLVRLAMQTWRARRPANEAQSFGFCRAKFARMMVLANEAQSFGLCRAKFARMMVLANEARLIRIGSTDKMSLSFCYEKYVYGIYPA